ncbi:MAG TPA: dehydrogenase [Planctomycetes bacterium]|nr:dehydrogenase [Planctomycetaceae bacterium]HIM28154.1 dehydrogenase [Planctomycetota bacterium]
MNCNRWITVVTTALLLLASRDVLAADAWPWWRGPSFDGIAGSLERPPTRWDESTNVIWKTTIPGRGHSSPIVQDNFVVLTTADKQAQVQYVLCYNRTTGKQLWKTAVNQGGFPNRIHAKNTHATPTAATDGQHIFVTFCNHDSVQLAALDFEGEIVWERKAGDYRPKKYRYGYAPSPLLYRDLIIVASEFESGGYLAAFNRSNGEKRWQTPRRAFVSYSSPVVGRVSGRDQLLISGADRVASYDPKTGNELWSVPGTTNATCGTLIWDDDLVYASGGYPKKETIAIRGDGSGIAWKNAEKCYEQSMLIHDGYIFAVNDTGIAVCWQAKSGQQMWKVRLGGPVSVSPVLAGGNIYISTERGKTFVFQANPEEFRAVANNQLGNEAFATPAFVGNRIFTRVAARVNGQRQEYLYCLGNE